MKHIEPRISTLFGMAIDDSDEQYSNASGPTIRSLESGSSVTSRSDLQDMRHFDCIISINFGMQIQASASQCENEPAKKTRESKIKSISLLNSRRSDTAGSKVLTCNRSSNRPSASTTTKELVAFT
jgi:hypothetical protein